jgi:Uma2 family endonuclease
MAMPATIQRYTVDDLEHFPRDGNRYELLDGVLLVTPAPGTPHQLVVSRISFALMNALMVPGHAFVFATGAVSFPPRTQLEPDILVVPARYPVKQKWHEEREHWLAVEVYSRSSRIYDHDFKRDNYLRLGVKEVWLVDRIARSVEITRELGRSETVSDAIVWRPPTLDVDVRIELSEIFAGIE